MLHRAVAVLHTHPEAERTATDTFGNDYGGGVGGGRIVHDRSPKGHRSLHHHNAGTGGGGGGEWGVNVKYHHPSESPKMYFRLTDRPVNRQTDRRLNYVPEAGTYPALNRPSSQRLEKKQNPVVSLPKPYLIAKLFFRKNKKNTQEASRFPFCLVSL